MNNFIQVKMDVIQPKMMWTPGEFQEQNHKRISHSVGRIPVTTITMESYDYDISIFLRLFQASTVIQDYLTNNNIYYA